MDAMLSMHDRNRTDVEGRSSEGRGLLDDAIAQCAAEITTLAGTDNSVEALHPAVSKYSRTLRECGVPPERALAAFKFMAFYHPVIAGRRVEQRVAAVHLLTNSAIRQYYADGNAERRTA